MTSCYWFPPILVSCIAEMRFGPETGSVDLDFSVDSELVPGVGTAFGEGEMQAFGHVPKAASAVPVTVNLHIGRASATAATETVFNNSSLAEVWVTVRHLECPTCHGGRSDLIVRSEGEGPSFRVNEDMALTVDVVNSDPGPVPRGPIEIDVRFYGEAKHAFASGSTSVVFHGAIPSIQIGS